ncbi:hypothetical protein [Limnobacter litoralis]|uniref:Uncharacterized protein n=1 Tax=Limnobacter litoralis TaxID=481366 RepID=A0ABQ5YRJ9_9BURK|nr:hypothetical protein [Limnobacter litoralis]GLR26521.1 hypothetical protein GCM10007875_16110 [Limnobacter litoralis]
MARPPFVPTEEQRFVTTVMLACGMPQEFICSQIINTQTGNPISKKTFEKAFRNEIDNCKLIANARVAQSLFKKAIGTGPQSVTAAIFWLKCHGGWKPVEAIELTGKNGGPIQQQTSTSDLTDEQLEKELAKYGIKL